jgi:pimeloyl-ACP methyl ester carboxylesterase
VPSAVLLLHGFGGSAARTWRDNGWLDLLGDAGRPTLAPDLLGHGNAPRPHDITAYDALEDLVEAQLAELGPDPVDAIGFSLGARVLLVLASRSPHRFSHLVLGGVGANLFRHDDITAFAEVLAGDEAPSDPAAAYFHQMIRSDGNDPVALTALLCRTSPPLDDAALGAITAPTLVVVGEHDFAGPAAPLVDRLADAASSTIARTDHFALPKNFGFLDAALEFIGAQP